MFWMLNIKPRYIFIFWNWFTCDYCLTYAKLRKIINKFESMSRLQYKIKVKTLKLAKLIKQGNFHQRIKAECPEKVKKTYTRHVLSKLEMKETWNYRTSIRFRVVLIQRHHTDQQFEDHLTFSVKFFGFVLSLGDWLIEVFKIFPIRRPVQCILSAWWTNSNYLF